MKTYPLLLAGGSLMAVMSTGTLAQDTPRDTFLGTLTLSGGENPTAPLDSSVAQNAASTKTSRPIAEVQASVSVIPRAQIEATGARNLAQALTYSAGVVAENYGGDPRFDSLFLRGFNLENDKFLDGLRLMRSTQFPTSAPAFDLYGIERVEVLRGPASLLYGAGTPAGMVNMIQKRAQASGDFTETGISADSNGSLALYGDANRVVNDRLAWRVTARLSNDRTDVRQIDNKRGYLGLSASYRLGDATEIEVMASYHADEPMSPTGVPPSLVGVVNARDLRAFNFADDTFNTSDRKMTTLGFGITHEFDTGWKLNGTFRYTNFAWDYRNIYLSGDGAGTVVNRGAIDQRDRFTAAAADIRLSGQMDTGAIRHELTFGVDAQRLSEDASTAFFNVNAIDFAAPVYGNVVADAPWYTAEKRVRATQIGLYALDEMSMGNWRATLGLRHEWTRQTGENVTDSDNESFARSDRQLTGHAGLGYVWDSGVSAYLSYATSYLPQPGFDIDGSALKPTQGRQWELGVKYAPTAFEGLFTAAAYDLRETDRNTTVTETIGGNPVKGLRQIGQVRIRGLELEAVAEFGEGWQVKSAYTYTTTRITGDNNGNELANTPRHAASLWVSHDFRKGALEGLTLGAGLRHIGGRWAKDANAERLDAVTLLDLGASYEFASGMTGRLSISNVADRAYISAIGHSSSYFGNGRTLQASLSHKW